MPATVDTICDAAQAERLVRILPHWLGHVPLYGAAANLLQPESWDGFDLGKFRRLPVITKRDIRHGFPRNFLAAGVELETLLDLDLIELEHTSGTSEARTPLLLGRGWWDEQERRALRLNRLVGRVFDEFPEARRVTINSPVCSGDVCYTGVPSRAERTVGNALFVNLSRHPFLWSESDLARMAAETLEWKPQFLDVDPVYGVLFARYCEREHIRLPSLQFILSSYEYTSIVHRRILQRAFGVPVFDLYGSTETGHLLMENESGQMMPSLDTAFLEAIELDVNGIGDLIVTTLTNEYMPLIRYRIGDLVECRGATSQGGIRLHGRAIDAFTSGEARVTTRQVDACFDGLPGIAHYQLREQEHGVWLLRFVPEESSLSAAELSQLHGRLAHTLQPAGRLDIEEVSTLLAEDSGKFRLGYPLAKARIRPSN